MAKRVAAKAAPAAPKLKAAEAIALVARQEKAIAKAKVQIKDLKAELRVSTTRIAELEAEVETLRKQTAQATNSRGKTSAKRVVLHTPIPKVGPVDYEISDEANNDEPSHAFDEDGKDLEVTTESAA